jgi:predicted nucleic acid-binding protein
MNVLVDTSVWSLALRRSAARLSAGEQAIVAELSQLSAEGRVVTIGPVRQELLTGIRHAAQFNVLRRRLREFPDAPMTTDDYERAAEAAKQCISAGVAVTDIDVLMCAVALDRGWQVFTLDQDFLRYRNVLGLALYGQPSAGAASSRRS